MPIDPSNQSYGSRIKGALAPIHVGILFLLLLLIVLRNPTLFSEPRFWAEESTVYFQVAYLSPLWEALIAPHQGYYSLWANLAGILANLVPLEFAPAVTTWMALLVLLVILGVVFSHESTTLNSTLKKSIAGVAILVAGAAGEIWLTTINSQHYLPLLVFLILIDNKQDSVKRRIGFLLVAIAGLSSVAANFLVPLFLLQYIQKRDRADLILFCILVLTSAAQVLAIAYSLLYLGPAAYYHPSQIRVPSDIHLGHIFRTIFYYVVAYPIFGFTALWGWIGAATLLSTMVMARRILRFTWHFPAAVLVLTTLSVFSSLGMQGGPRYAYASTVIVLLMLLTYSGHPNISGITRWSARFLLLASIAFWSMHYRDSLDKYQNSSWPKWADEVKAWRTNPDHALQTHPIWADQTAIGLRWAINLPKK